MKRVLRFSAPARPLRQHNVHFDNLTLPPGSLLPIKVKHQALASRLPGGQVPIVMPEARSPHCMAAEPVVHLLQAMGRHVTTIPARQLL
jgi:hypothetical protein